MKMDKKIISWHLFGDQWDEWYNTRKEAEQAYKLRVLEDKNVNLRLYKDWSYKDDQEVEEDYIKGRGNYPW